MCWYIIPRLDEDFNISLIMLNVEFQRVALCIMKCDHLRMSAHVTVEWWSCLTKMLQQSLPRSRIIKYGPKRKAIVRSRNYVRTAALNTLEKWLPTYVKSQGIEHNPTAAFSPQSNGVAERMKQDTFRHGLSYVRRCRCPRRITGWRSSHSLSHSEQIAHSQSRRHVPWRSLDWTKAACKSHSQIRMSCSSPYHYEVSSKETRPQEVI